MKIKLITSLLGLSALPALGATINLSNWVVQDHSPGAGNWTVAADQLSVFQSINGEPTVFLSDVSALGTKIVGKIKVETTGDDDFVGFVLGFDNGDFTDANADFLLIDWKQGNQSFGGFNASSGLAVTRITGAVPVAGVTEAFWGHMGAKADELARGATLGATGWTDNTEYSFIFEFSASNLKVSVNGNQEINLNGNFSDGNLGFYNYSQSSVRYSGFEQDVLPPVDPPVGVPEGGSGIVLLGLSLAGLGLVSRKMRVVKA